jgi:hypothetical protein
MTFARRTAGWASDTFRSSVKSCTALLTTTGATASGSDSVVSFGLGALLARSFRPFIGASSLEEFCVCVCCGREDTSEGSEGAEESVCCFLDLGDDEVDSLGGAAEVATGAEDGTTSADDCAWGDVCFAAKGEVVVVSSNGNGREDSLKAWPLEVRRSVTTQQQGEMLRRKHNSLAQSKEHYFLL